jgi:hypothetical protein
MNLANQHVRVELVRQQHSYLVMHEFLMHRMVCLKADLRRSRSCSIDICCSFCPDPRPLIYLLKPEVCILPLGVTEALGLVAFDESEQNLAQLPFQLGVVESSLRCLVDGRWCDDQIPVEATCSSSSLQRRIGFAVVQ